VGVKVERRGFVLRFRPEDLDVVGLLANVS
jgi:hypothetical protein